jgi:hypothetical protein
MRATSSFNFVVMTSIISQFFEWAMPCIINLYLAVYRHRISEIKQLVGIMQLNNLYNQLLKLINLYNYLKAFSLLEFVCKFFWDMSSSDRIIAVSF